MRRHSSPEMRDERGGTLRSQLGSTSGQFPMINATYDERFVPAHGEPTGPRVLLVNEAPGPIEAAAGIPLFGQQGANLFHALRAAGIRWAYSHPKFVWPCSGALLDSENSVRKAAFLKDRARNMTCTNAFPRWPKPNADSSGFCAPLDVDVLGGSNLERLRSEIAQTHKAVMVCGRSAFLACVGAQLLNPANRECSALLPKELSALNERLGARFENGWYMGHTRRWSTRPGETRLTLRELARCVAWELVDDAGDFQLAPVAT